MRAIDLFCGIGGFRLGLAPLGPKFVFACDIDRQAREAYKTRFGEMPAGDITQINARDIPDHDLLCAGFPCQSFSVTGNRKGFRDGRGQLFYEIIRIAKAKRPQLLLLENVRSIVGMDKGRVLEEIYSHLDKAGYRPYHTVLNAGDFGIPQARHRCYFVAIRKDLDWHFTPPQPSGDFKTLNSVLEINSEVPSNYFFQRTDFVIEEYIREPIRKMQRVGYFARGKQPDGSITQGYRIYTPFGWAATQTAHGGGMGVKTGCYYIAGKVRRLTPHESAGAMGLPPSYGAFPQRLIGNAVIPKMVEIVYNGIRAA